jgi:O-antigen/teichoic acid export membrane protein
VKTVVKYSLRYYLALSIPAVFLLSILSKPILNILTTAEIALNGFLITPLVALGALLFGLYTILSQIIILTKKTKIIGVVWIIAAIINIALNLIAVPFIGIIGAAIVTLVTYTVTLAFILVYSSRYMTLPFDPGFILKSIFASAVAGAFVFLLNPQSLLGIVIVAILGVILYTIVLIISKGFEKKEINFFMGFLRDILKDLKSVTARF